MRTSVTLGFMALLAACGGSGTPTVEVSPPIAEEMIPEVQPPDPVTFVFDNGDKVELTATDGSLVFDGVTYQVDDQQVSHATEISLSSTDTSSGLSLVRVAGGDALSTFAVLTAIPGIDTTSYIMALQGSSTTVPTLDNVPMGAARFQGEYAGIYIVPGPFDRNGNPWNDIAAGAIFGDVILNVEFGDYLSQSTVSGVVENREIRDIDDGSVNTTITLADMVIENGGFDDAGQLIADVSGGEQLCPQCDPEDVHFVTTEGVLNGQLGGADGTVVGGTISLLQHRYERGPAPDFEILDEFQYSRPEVGVFIATAD